MGLEDLYKKVGFKPNKSQRNAIEHNEGPLYLVAGPGSGKTRVLLWRTLNLIVFKKIKPEEIFLSTFTEKAAEQLKNGLVTLLGAASQETGVHYDISKMYIGTVHSLCQRLISDKRFTNGIRARVPRVMDDLDQYFFLYENKFWSEIHQELNLPLDYKETINSYLDKVSSSKHNLVSNCISLFNRFSEECIEPEDIIEADSDEILKILAKIYGKYKEKLQEGSKRIVDFSLLQQYGYEILCDNTDSPKIFKYVIIDEYQDTNSIQEKIFFKLTEGYKNICVVGDDDQSLYRFRGATVENFVQFESRCSKYLKVIPRKIKLNINYRSRKKIVEFYKSFIEKEDWENYNIEGTYFRNVDKNIVASSSDCGISVVKTPSGKPQDVYIRLAHFIKKLIDEKVVADPNEIAVLFTYLNGNKNAERLKEALNNLNIEVYAPRAGRFLENIEPKAIFGLFSFVFGRPKVDVTYNVGKNQEFNEWLDQCEALADEIVISDNNLRLFIEKKKREILELSNDFRRINGYMTRKGITMETEVNMMSITKFKKEIIGLSKQGVKELNSIRLTKAVERRIEERKPVTFKWLVTRINSLDWNLLDLFYRLCGYDYFKDMFNLAEQGIDEVPICNLSKVSQYLSIFIEKYVGLITGSVLNDDKFIRLFYTSYLGALYRRGESEYESKEELIPRGRISFLTIHQSKGLEFPVVVLGAAPPEQPQPRKIEEIIRPFLKGEYEPLEKISAYDRMRAYYVALSRAERLLILPNLRGPGIKTHRNLKSTIETEEVPEISDVDINTIPKSMSVKNDIEKVYSYTADYLAYNDCPRKYMIYRKYDFAPARTTISFFGNLVHKTIEDLHNALIDKRG